MSNPLQSLKIDHWYKAVLVISAALLLAALTIPFQGIDNANAAILCLGGVCLGLGEWKNHPIQIAVGFNFTVTSYPRRFTVVGCLLSLLGISLIAYGIYRLIF